MKLHIILTLLTAVNLIAHEERYHVQQATIDIFSDQGAALKHQTVVKVDTVTGRTWTLRITAGTNGIQQSWVEVATARPTPGVLDDIAAVQQALTWVDEHPNGGSFHDSRDGTQHEYTAEQVRTIKANAVKALRDLNAELLSKRPTTR